MTDETAVHGGLPSLGDPDDDGGDFAIEHQATTVDDNEDEAAGWRPWRTVTADHPA